MSTCQNIQEFGGKGQLFLWWNLYSIICKVSDLGEEKSSYILLIRLVY